VLSIYRPILEPMGLTHPQYLVMLALWPLARPFAGPGCAGQEGKTKVDDSHTGKAWSADVAHYRPVCAAH
jgi:hypothetical protein